MALPTVFVSTLALMSAPVALAVAGMPVPGVWGRVLTLAQAVPVLVPILVKVHAVFLV